MPPPDVVPATGPSTLASRAEQRRTLKALRRVIPPAQRIRAARQLARHAARAFHLAPGKRVALYAPLPSEMSTAPLEQLARRRGCRLYLPRITDKRRSRMQFIEAAGPMRANHLGILEPVRIRAIPARFLDLVFLPLVGFDAAGNRLGMGAGYYDRAFAFRRLRIAWRQPHLVGVGYSLQQLPRIVGEPHDVPLDHVVTEKGVITCSTG